MTWKDVGNFIGEAAPLVGSVIGGPAGGAVGAAISSMLGVENKPDEVVKALKTNPDAILKLKQYEMQHQEKLQELNLKKVELDYEDIKDARQRQVAHEQATGKSDINLYVLAWVVVVGFYTLIGVLMFKSIPGANNNVVYLLLGTLSTGFGMVLQYFFGSSKGSKDKTNLLARIKSTIAPAKETVME